MMCQISSQTCLNTPESALPSAAAHALDHSRQRGPPPVQPHPHQCYLPALSVGKLVDARVAWLYITRCQQNRGLGCQRLASSLPSSMSTCSLRCVVRDNCSRCPSTPLRMPALQVCVASEFAERLLRSSALGQRLTFSSSDIECPAQE